MIASKMIANKLKALWAQGKPAINGWCSIGNPFTAEIMAAQGFDAVTIDMQHDALDYSNLLAMFQAMRARHGADGPRAVERARHRDEGAGRRGLRHHLPDGQHRCGCRPLCQLSALSALGAAQLLPDAVSFVARRIMPGAIGWGFDLTTVGGDSRFLAAAAGAAVTRFRDLTQGEAKVEKGAY